MKSMPLGCKCNCPKCSISVVGLSNKNLILIWPGGKQKSSGISCSVTYRDLPKNWAINVLCLFLLFSHCCLCFPAVSMVINYCESRPLKDWCVPASDVFPRVSRPPLKFSETKLYCALLRGMERFHGCVRQYLCFFPLLLWSCLFT